MQTSFQEKTLEDQTAPSSTNSSTNNSMYYKEKMALELTKFINVYNKFSSDPFSFKCIDDSKYEYIVRVLGNYISKHYSKENWLNTALTFPFGGEFIDLSVFKDTEWKEPIENFLESLKDAFYSSLSQEIKTYFDSAECEFTGTEKVLCQQFFERVTEVNEEVFKSAFKDTTTDICSQEAIGEYSDALKRFNDFVKECSHPLHMKILERFSSVMKKIASGRKQVNVFFQDKL